MTEEKMAIDNTILRVLTGSELYGTRVDSSAGDRDEIGICIEDPEYVFGLQKFNEHVHRDAAIRAMENGRSKHTAKSEAGDLDLTIYSLRRFLGLVVNGNPTLALIMYTPKQAQLVSTPLGDELLALAPKLACKNTAKRFRGYLNDQRERMMGLRGQKDVNRPELVQKYGFDTKFAGHVIRLGLQGLEYLKTGRITLPMPESERTLVVDVRNGRYTLQQVDAMATDLYFDLLHWQTASSLPAHPDVQAVDRFLIDAYPRHWSAAAR